MNLKIYADGASRGNPGPAGIGLVILDESGQVIEEYSRYLGETTNNVAEYQALINALTIAKKYVPCSIDIYMDSELVVKQMQGLYRVKNQILMEHFRNVQMLTPAFDKIIFTHIPREQNKLADNLANIAINTARQTR
jgi:ribonuclease HI